MACVTLHFALQSTNPLLAAHVPTNQSWCAWMGFIWEWNCVCLAWCFAWQSSVELATAPSTMGGICTMLPGCWHSLLWAKSSGIPVLCHGEIPPQWNSGHNIMVWRIKLYALVGGLAFASEVFLAKIQLNVSTHSGTKLNGIMQETAHPPLNPSTEISQCAQRERRWLLICRTRVACDYRGETMILVCERVLSTCMRNDCIGELDDRQMPRIKQPCQHDLTSP
jgi:hypothetical protein